MTISENELRIKYKIRINHLRINRPQPVTQVAPKRDFADIMQRILSGDKNLDLKLRGERTRNGPI